MRPFAIAISLFFCAWSQGSVQAQSFWYSPPGYSYGIYHDLGNGIGYGYGVGAGVPFTLDQLNTTSTPNLEQPGYGSGDFGAMNGNNTNPVSPTKFKKNAKTKGIVLKKNDPSAPVAKGVSKKGGQPQKPSK